MPVSELEYLSREPYEGGRTFDDMGCGCQKPNPDWMTVVDLAVVGDQLKGARGYWLQVGWWLRFAGSRKRLSTVEIGRGIALSVVLPCTTGSSDGSWGSGRAAVLVMESAEMRKSDDVA